MPCWPELEFNLVVLSLSLSLICSPWHTGLIVPDCRCVCNSGSSLTIITDSSLTSLLSTPLFPVHLWIESFPTRLQGSAKTAEQQLLLPTIPTTSYWPLRSLTALLPVFHPTSIHPRISLFPLTNHHRPHFKRGCGLTGSSNAAPQAFVWEVLVHCRFTSLPVEPSGFGVSRYWLLSRTDIVVCKCARGT